MVKLPINPFLEWVEKRIKKNKNCLVLVNGPTGGGKSYSCISLAQELAEKLGTPFNVKDNLAFKFTDLLDKMDLPQNNGAGTCFVFEETGSVGSGAGARQWQSKANQFFFSFAQTSRHRNQILFMNCPNFSFLEKGTRSLIHFQIECVGIDNIKKQVVSRPYRVQINSRTGKFYFKYLRVRYEGRTIKFNCLRVDHPGEEVAKVYEKLKYKFTDELNKMIRDSEKEKPKKRPSIDKFRLKELLEQGLTQKEVSLRLGVSVSSIKRYKKRIFGEKPLRKGGFLVQSTNKTPF